MTLPAGPRPSRPLPVKPAGYLSLAHYSSLGHLWRLLAGATQAGRIVTVLRGDSEETARRRISGYTLDGAGFFLDIAPVLTELEDGFNPHPALLSLLAGDNAPLKAELNAHYTLKLDFIVALTAQRDFVARPEFKFVPTGVGASTLPSDLPLKPRRLGRDELNLLLLRACGLAG